MTPNRWPLRRALFPDDASLNITYSCDLACVGCNRACFIKPAVIPPMTPERLNAMFDHAIAEGVRFARIRFVGGEPTLHPQLESLVAVACRRAPRGCRVDILSNQYGPKARESLTAVSSRYPRLVVRQAAKHDGRVEFPWRNRTLLVHPLDAGYPPVPHPCRWVIGRRRCGMGVDQLGYTLCPMGGIIDSLLGLNARATTLAQMRDLDFVRHQAAVLCSNCGAYMNYSVAQVSAVSTVRDSPVSARFQAGITRLGQQGVA